MNKQMKKELRDLRSFAQGFLQSTFVGFGQGTGCAVGGWLWYHYGDHWVFLVTAGMLMPLWLLTFLQQLFKCCNLSCKKQNEKENIDNYQNISLKKQHILK